MTDWSAALAHAFEISRKNGGSSGTRGTAAAKPSRQQEFSDSASTTGQKNRVVQLVQVIETRTTATGPQTNVGDASEIEICIDFQKDAVVRTARTARTTDFDPSWKNLRALDKLRSISCPDVFGERLWAQFLSDAEKFLPVWEEQSRQRGWTDTDLFGVHPIAPAARYDAMGLIPLIRSGEVIEMDTQIAILRSAGGSRLVVCKPRFANPVALWDYRT
jgi:hypothetical protein